MTKTDGVPFHEMLTVISDSGDISDSGRVRIGNMSPSFPVMPPLVRGKPISISDTGEVRIGDYSAAIGSGSTAEPNIRIAAVSPTFAPVRSR
jgi:hypothetical protein